MSMYLYHYPEEEGSWVVVESRSATIQAFFDSTNCDPTSPEAITEDVVYRIPDDERVDFPISEKRKKRKEEVEKLSNDKTSLL